MNNDEILKIIGRKTYLFSNDDILYRNKIENLITDSSFLIIGGAGSIGSSVVNDLFVRNPKKLHIVDISENSLVEVVRNLRSSIGYIKGDFRTFTFSYGNINFDNFYSEYGPYDYILNFAALKHVRSERDNFTLQNMLITNVSYVVENYLSCQGKGVKKYFTVSTDKAANPHNLMGASKKVMEILLSSIIPNSFASFARFANVAFSNGSLLNNFEKRFSLHQPIAVPSDIYRYFITPNEASLLCIFSTLLADSNQLLIPRECESFKPESFVSILKNFLEYKGFEMFKTESEDEARIRKDELIKSKKWPCYIFNSDTTGEKEVEEFYNDQDKFLQNNFNSIDTLEVERELQKDISKLYNFFKKEELEKNFSKEKLLNILSMYLKGFNYVDLNKSLDEKM